MDFPVPLQTGICPSKHATLGPEKNVPGEEALWCPRSMHFTPPAARESNPHGASLFVGTRSALRISCAVANSQAMPKIHGQTRLSRAIQLPCFLGVVVGRGSWLPRSGSQYRSYAQPHRADCTASACQPSRCRLFVVPQSWFGEAVAFLGVRTYICISAAVWTKAASGGYARGPRLRYSSVEYYRRILWPVLRWSKGTASSCQWDRINAILT